MIAVMLANAIGLSVSVLKVLAESHVRSILVASTKIPESSSLYFMGRLT